MNKNELITVLSDTREQRKPRLGRGEFAAWAATQQGLHHCACGCGQAITIQKHHYARGIPKFIDGHVSRVNNPMSGRNGELNPNFKRGWYKNQDGYIVMLNPNGDSPKYVLQHRYVMEQHLGRPLSIDEIVHHKNRNKADNRIDNLELKTNAEHTAEHARLAEVGILMLRQQGRTFKGGRPCPI